MQPVASCALTSRHAQGRRAADDIGAVDQARGRFVAGPGPRPHRRFVGRTGRACGGCTRRCIAVGDADRGRRRAGRGRARCRRHRHVLAGRRVRAAVRGDLPGGVFWLSAADPWSEQLTAIAEALGANGKGHAADRVALVLDDRGEPSLWVVDGVPAGLELDQVRRLLSPHPTAASVLTTTDASYAELGAGVIVPELPAAQAIKLVLNQVDALAPGDRGSAHKLVDAVEGTRAPAGPGRLGPVAAWTRCGGGFSPGLARCWRRPRSGCWPRSTRPATPAWTCCARRRRSRRSDAVARSGWSWPVGLAVDGWPAVVVRLVGEARWRYRRWSHT